MSKYSKAYYAVYKVLNKERIKAYYSEYNQRPEVKARIKKWYYENHEKNKEKRKLNNVLRRKQLIDSLGGRCKTCNYNADWRALQIDHVNGGGNHERRGYGHSASALKRRVLEDLKNSTGRYQLLCANCNWIKRIENKELFWKETKRQWVA